MSVVGLFEVLFPATARRITTLEFQMALTDAALADLDDATNAVADELDELRGELKDSDSALALRISAAADRLRGLAADPNEPVPPAPPAPAPAPEPAPEPPTDANA